MNRIVLIVVMLAAVVYGCKEEPVGRQPVDSVAPGAVSEVSYSPTPGGAVFRYKLPADADLMYVKAVYYRDAGVASEAKASIYADSLVIQGFGDTSPKEVNLYAVDRSGNVSEPYPQTVVPLEPNIFHVGTQLELVPDFGGVRALWTNDSGEEVAIVVLQKDSLLGEYVVFDRTYSTAKQGSFAVGNNSMKPKPVEVGVYAQDRWGHVTETKYYILEPRYLVEFNKERFSAITLPGDAPLLAGYPMTRLWDGTRELFVAIQDQGRPCEPITFDMGVLGKVYRIQMLWAISDAWAWRGGSAKFMKIYGSAELDPSGSWDNWTLIYDYISVKPSGLPPGENTEEDLRVFNAGDLYEIDPDLPKMRYIRIHITESWANQGVGGYQIAECTIFGDDREDNP